MAPQDKHLPVIMKVKFTNVKPFSTEIKNEYKEYNADPVK